MNDEITQPASTTALVDEAPKGEPSISVPMTLGEIRANIQLIDLAVKAGGIQVAKAGVHLFEKFDQMAAMLGQMAPQK